MNNPSIPSGGVSQAPLICRAITVLWGVITLTCVFRPDILAALALVPTWLWTIPGLGLGVLAWRQGLRRWATVSSGLWLVFGAIYVEECTTCPRWIISRSASETRPAGTIRVVSLNCANTTQCLSDLQSADPDIALLQESPSLDDLQRMAFELFGASGVAIAGGDTAILARGSIVPSDDRNHQTYVAGTVTLSGHAPIHCVSLRLSPPVPRIDGWTPSFWTEHRAKLDQHRRELHEIKAVVPARIPTIVGGDFNTTPRDSALAELSPALVDAFPRSGIGAGATGTNDCPLFRVDQIWTTHQLIPDACWACKTRHSDHRMVICDLVAPQ